VPKKTNETVALEIVPRDRAQQADDFKRMVEQLVEQKVAEVTHGRDAVLQPWFLSSHEAAWAIKRAQTVPEQQKFANYFADYGCMICETTTAAHRSLGMCGTCYSRTVARIRSTLRKHAPSPDQPQPTFTDTVELAREALGPSIKKLAASTTTKRSHR
jgi:hypothetical protein